MEISLRTLIPYFRSGSDHSGLASWDDWGRMFPDKLRVSSFLDRFSHYAWTAASSAHSDFDGSRVCACLGVTCHLHFWQNDRGILRTTAVTRGWNGHRIRVSTQSWLWRRRFPRRPCRDSNSQPFDHESDAITNNLSRLVRKRKAAEMCFTTGWIRQNFYIDLILISCQSGGGEGGRGRDIHHAYSE